MLLIIHKHIWARTVPQRLVTIQMEIKKKGTNTFANKSAHAFRNKCVPTTETVLTPSATGLLRFRWTPFSYWKTPNFGELGNATLQTKTYECGVWVNITLKVHLILSTGAEQQQSQLTKQTRHTLHESAPKCTYFCSDIWIDNWEYVILNR